jgi:AcrR family transcriptional regulator
MTAAIPSVGRRERNKQEKLERITRAARELFAERGVDEVTTQQIADRADIGSGTLFLYAKTKGELLLLVQNEAYADALERGVADSESAEDDLSAVLAIVRPIIECNRVQVDNGRTYLREMVFGDPTEPRHQEALEIVAKTEAALASALRRTSGIDTARAATTARIVSAVLFLSMAAGVNAESSIPEMLQDVTEQLRVLLPSRPAV